MNAKKLHPLPHIDKSILPIGLGCMGMSEFYGESDDTNSVSLLHKAFEMGVNFWDTADTYGLGHNESLIGQCIRETGINRDDLVIATKFGISRKQGSYERCIDNSPEYIQHACEASLKRLGVETIDLYYCHRRNTETPIEVMMERLAQLVTSGKIKGIGLSEVSADTIRQAHAIHPLTAVQSEYSLWSRDAENDIIETCKELGITFVAYSPLGRAFLTGKLDTTTLNDGDFRNALPRLQGEAYHDNKALVDTFSDMTQSWNMSNAQACLAWICNKHEHVVPIAGTRREKYLIENANAVNISLNGEQIQALDNLFSPDVITGKRYPEAGWVGIEN